MLGGSCIVKPIRLLKGKHHPLLGTNCRKIPITLIDPGEGVLSTIAVLNGYSVSGAEAWKSMILMIR